MSIYVWTSEPSAIYVWDTQVCCIYVWDCKVWPQLLCTYEELISMSFDDAYTELSLYPEEYYNLFNWNWHLVYWWAWSYQWYWLWNWVDAYNWIYQSYTSPLYMPGRQFVYNNLQRNKWIDDSPA